MTRDTQAAPAPWTNPPGFTCSAVNNGDKGTSQKPVREEQLVTQAQPSGDRGQVPHEEGQNRSPEPGPCAASPWGSGRLGGWGESVRGQSQPGPGPPPLPPGRESGR